MSPTEETDAWDALWAQIESVEGDLEAEDPALRASAWEAAAQGRRGGFGPTSIVDRLQKITLADALATYETDQWITLKTCPVCSDAPHDKRRGGTLRIATSRKTATVICYDPAHGHAPEDARQGARGDYWVWTYRTPRPDGAAVIPRADDASIAADFRAELHRRYGMVAIDPKGGFRYYVDGADLPASKRPERAGTWAPLSDVLVMEGLQMRMAKLKLRSTNKDLGEILTPIEVNLKKSQNVLEMVRGHFRAREELATKTPGRTRFDDRSVVVTTGTAILPDGSVRIARASDHVLSELDLGLSLDHSAEAREDWEAYLASMLPPDEIRLLQMWTGAAMTGAASSRLQKAVILLGQPGSGKSTLGRFLASVVPERARTSLSFGQLSEKFVSAELFGKLLNFFPESETSDGKLDVARLKALFDASTMTAERKYGQPFTFQATCAHLFCANSLPRAGSGGALYQRVAVLSTQPQDWRNKTDKDVNFYESRVKTWAPAILSWALEGLRALHAASWRLPKVQSVEATLAQWRGDCDPVADWVSGLTKAGPNDWVKQADALKAYNLWAEGQGHQPMGARGFGQKLSEVGVARKKNSDMMVNLKVTNPDLELDLDGFDSTPAIAVMPVRAVSDRPRISDLAPDDRATLIAMIRLAVLLGEDEAKISGDLHAADRRVAALLENY